MKYIISYDLLAPGKNYDAPWAALVGLGGQRLLLSQWILKRSNTNCVNLRDHLRRFIDQNDRLLVTALDGADWASWNLMHDPNTV